MGDRCLEGILTNETSEQAKGESVEVAIRASELHRDPPDLTTQLRLYSRAEEAPATEPRYGGFLTELEAGKDGWWIVRSNNLAHLGDHLSAGITAKRVPPMELFWSTMRGAGMPPERLHMHGWRPPREPMIVALPITGIQPIGELQAGQVRLTKDPEVPKLWAELSHDEVKEPFESAGFWAVMRVEANTLFDAEQTAVRHFERVIDRLALAAHYASAELPNGELRPYQRQRQLEQIRLVSVAGVHGLKTRRTWLRGYAHPRAVQSIDSAVLTGVADYIGSGAPRIDEAVAAWRRACTEDDPAVAVVALAEAIEFYAAGVKIPPLFTRVELDSLRAAIPTRLADKKVERIRLMIDRLNDPPATARLRAALVADGVRFSEAEFGLLVVIRGLRNKILHGQERELPSEDDLAQALSLVNRMLLFRLRANRVKTTKE